MSLPDLPKPRCKVRLVCGPPAAGKSTYVAKHAGPDDVVIDLDLIAQELGLPRNEMGANLPALVTARNIRLASLAREPPSRLAWVIMTLPGAALRKEWQTLLGADPPVVLVPPRAELHRRILADPQRVLVRTEQRAAVAEWFAREHGGTTLEGYPQDPAHPWSRKASPSYPHRILSNQPRTSPEKDYKRSDPFYNSPYWREIRQIILERDEYRCCVPGCHEDATHVDHIRSRSQGGDERLSNLRSFCSTHDAKLREHKSGERGLQGKIPSIAGRDGLPQDPSHPWFRKAKPA